MSPIFILIIANLIVDNISVLQLPPGLWSPFYHQKFAQDWRSLKVSYQWSHYSLSSDIQKEASADDFDFDNICYQGHDPE